MVKGDRKSVNWIQKGDNKHPGLFAKKAKNHGLTTRQFTATVLKNPHKYPMRTDKEAVFANNAMNASKKRRS